MTLSAATERAAPESMRFDWEEARAIITVRLFVLATVKVTDADVASETSTEGPMKGVSVEYPEISAPVIVYAISLVVKLFVLLVVIAISSATCPAASLSEYEYNSEF